MGRNLLFISKYPEIIEEFTREMGDKEIDIDIADNGIDAAMLIKKKEYDIVITGLVLDGYNGEQIITYLNKHHPDTVCIIYTTTISAAQLHYFLNKRDVFKVFLRPVNFRQEFFQALEEAFEYSNIKQKDREDLDDRKRKLIGNRDAIHEMEACLDRQNRGWGRLGKFSAKIINYTVEQYGKGLTEKDKKETIEKELKILSKACKNHDAESLRECLEATNRIL